MKKEEVKTYSIEENHHSGLELELHFMPRFFVDNPCCAEPHTHEFYQIIWFRRGHGTHHVDFVDYPVTDNTIFFIAPGQIHSFDGVTDYEGVIIHFNANFMADEETSESVFLKYDVFNAYDSLSYYKVSNDEAERLMTLVNEMNREYSLTGAFAHKDYMQSLLCFKHRSVSDLLTDRNRLDTVCKYDTLFKNNSEIFCYSKLYS